MASSNNSQFNRRIFIIKPELFARMTTTTTTATTLSSSLSTFVGPDGRVILPNLPNTKPPEGTASTATYALCGSFLPCNPIGCEDPSVAPIDCEECDKTATGFVVFGMIIMSLLITVANFLVIRVILRTPSLRRRHGYIKLSMATSDLLVGLLVIPAATANLVLTLYYPMEIDETKYSKDEINSKKTELLMKKNSTTSVMFGTIAIVSVISSLYNLLLLSVDRFIAIARPLKHRAGKYFPKRSLWLSISAVWIFAVALSSVPAFFPNAISYKMDETTFFFVQSLSTNGDGSFPPIYALIVIGGPYFLTILLILLTTFYTWKSLKVRNRLSGRGKMSKSAIQRKCERNNRIKMIKEAYPDALDDEDVPSIRIYRTEISTERLNRKGHRRGSSGDKKTWLSWWKADDCAFGNRNNNSDKNEESTSSQSPRYQRTRDQMSIVREILNPPKKRTKAFNKSKHMRVFKMLIAMIIGYSVCLLPYIIVILLVDGKKLECSNLSVPYAIAVYMMFLNSGMNFIIYNLFHPEFRSQLRKTIRNDFSKRFNRKDTYSNSHSVTPYLAACRNTTATTSFN